MAKFRKKPVVVEAIQYTGRNSMDVLAWAKTPEISEDFTGGIEIPTPGGVVRADPWDWVIRGVAGEFYPCKPDVFTATYEAVE